MLFNSYEFILVFLPLSLIVYFLLNRARLTVASKSWLVSCSLFFYSWGDVKYLPLILGSIFINYGAGSMLAQYTSVKEKLRTLILIAGISVNVLLLGYFKYTDFFISSLNIFSNISFELQHIVLPLGISFFTFTQIAYLVDTYRNKVKEYDFLNYALFVTFFPHLLAGPIIHHKEMMPQFNERRNKILNYRNISAGTFLFFIGLFKKTVLADRFAVWANSGYQSAGGLTFLESWATSLSYTFHLYFDFSGYTDMALGASLMFNIILPFNFNSPYKALDIQDFWNRWHMTLSRFLKDYIYIPMGGNKSGINRMYLNLMLTFIIGGLWHGAGWTFVFWGFLHGAAILIHRIWKRTGLSVPDILGWFITFNFVNIAWVFFRASQWDDAIKVLAGMSGLNGIMLPNAFSSMALLNDYGVSFSKWSVIMKDKKDSFLYIVLSIIFCLAMKNSGEILKSFKPDWKTGIITIFMATYGFLNIFRLSEFLYFNF